MMSILSKKIGAKNFSFFVFLVLPSLIFASNRNRMYDAYVSGNRTVWIEIVDEMEHSDEIKTLPGKLELIEYYYGMSGYYIGMKKFDLATISINKGEALVDNTLIDNPLNATAMAFKGSFTAFKINLNRLKVLFLGKESLKWLDKALEIDPDNVQALANRGNALIHAPAIFGGDPAKGILMFRKSLALMEKRNQAVGNWFYLHMLITTADAYIRTEQPDKARLYYERALKVEPNFSRVKEKLLPALDKK